MGEKKNAKIINRAVHTRLSYFSGLTDNTTSDCTHTQPTSDSLRSDGSNSVGMRSDGTNSLEKQSHGRTPSVSSDGSDNGYTNKTYGK